MDRKSLLGLIATATVLAGCGSSHEPPQSGKAFAYSESTIDRFVTLCLQRSRATVAQCACVLERYRTEAPEAEFLQAISQSSPDKRMSTIFGECDMDPSGSFVVATPTPEAQGAVPTSVSLSAAGVNASSSVPAAAPGVASTPTAPVVRAATSSEACIQEKLAAAQAKAGGGSVPLDLYDKIRAECGG